MKRLTEIEKAWLAAAIDGEGHIEFGRRNKRGTVEVYVQVCNTHLGFINKCREVVGVGVVREHRRKARPTWLPVFTWWVKGHTLSAELLRQVFPYLIIKQDIAKRVILFSEHRAGRSRWRGQGLRYGAFEKALLKGEESEIEEIRRLL